MQGRLSVDHRSSDAEDTQYVYNWRLQQEAALRASKGTGMTDEQVVNFVNGCKSAIHGRALTCLLTRTDYPAYELYTDVLRQGIFSEDKGKQLRLVVGEDRRVREVQVI